MVIPAVKRKPLISDADDGNSESDSDENERVRVEPEPFAKATPLSKWAKSCALPKKNSKMELDSKIVPLMVLPPTTKIYVHYSKEDQREDKAQPQPVTLWTRRDPLDLFANTPSLPDIDLNAEAKTAKHSQFSSPFRPKQKPPFTEHKELDLQKNKRTKLEKANVKVTQVRPPPIIPSAKVETRLSRARSSKPEDSKVSVSRSKAKSEPPAAKMEAEYSKAFSRTVVVDSNVKVIHSRTTPRAGAKVKITGSKASSATLGLSAKVKVTQSRVSSTTYGPGAKVKITRSRASSANSGPSAKVKITRSRASTTPGTSANSTPSTKLEVKPSRTISKTVKSETKPLRATPTTQGARVENSRQSTPGAKRIRSTPPHAKVKAEITRPRPKSTTPAGNLNSLPPTSSSRASGKSQLPKAKKEEVNPSRARPKTPRTPLEVTAALQQLSKEPLKVAKIKPKPFLVNSGTDIFSEYEDVYQEIMEKDFGLSFKQVRITQPRRPRAVGKVRIRQNQTPRTATPKSAGSSGVPPTTAATMGSSADIKNVDSSIIDELAESKPLCEYYPDLRSLTPLSTASTISETTINRQIGGYDLKQTESLLPYWINRRTWNMKKLERQQRLDEAAVKSGKRCTQIFPGGFYNQTQEDRVRRIRENERSWMYGGPRSVQSERELKLKRLWEQLDLAKSEKTHIDIPYRQGSTVVLGFPGHGGLVDTDLNSTKAIPTTESEAELHSLKVGFYRHVASSNRKLQLMKKRKEHEKRMAAKQCINDVCKSKADRIAEAKARGFLPGEIVNPPILEPWLAPDETKTIVKRIGYKYSSYKPSTSLRKKSESGTTNKLKSNSKMVNVGKLEGETAIKSFASLLAKPDYEATYFKLCPNCGKYVRHSDAATHATECSAAEKNKASNSNASKRPPATGGMSVNSYNSYTEQQRWLSRPSSLKK